MRKQLEWRKTMTKAREYWRMFCVLLGINEDIGDNLFEQLVARYASTSRYYHTLDGHIVACICEFSVVRDLAGDPIVAEAALWMHDAFYDTHCSTNEEGSACWAVEFFKEAGIAFDFEKLIGLILMTKHHQPSNDRDALIVSDCDLAILGRDMEVFDEYERNIRREYEWVPEKIYRERRANLLEKFLERPEIYYTQLFHEKYETQARVNIARSVGLLKSNKPLL